MDGTRARKIYVFRTFVCRQLVYMQYVTKYYYFFFFDKL